MHRLLCIKDSLLTCVETQMDHLDTVDAKELGEVIDMIKDLEEAIYYKTITESMTGVSGVEPNHETHMEKRDHKEGRSHHSRKVYMANKEIQVDKATQMRELEKYMSELTQDLLEMIESSSADERQYMEKKLTMMASKIGQMNN